MANWKQVLLSLAVDAEAVFDDLKARLATRFTSLDPWIILPYRGFGTQEHLYLKGRVLQDKGIQPAADDDGLWDNLLNMYRRFESDEAPYARVEATFDGVSYEVRADEEGFFEVWLEPQQPLPSDKLWHQVKLRLLEPQLESGAAVEAEGQVYVPPPSARLGVLSDIDDTVLQTDASSLLRMARTVFLSNARTRLPFKGVGAFYRALFAGASGQENNPLFYISSSPWNLYDLLSDFFNLQDIPIGPILFLRDWGISETEFLPIRHREYKMGVIRKVLSLYPDLPFILLGDSGQEDPEIYAEALKEFPGQIRAIYIRNVSRDLARPEAIRELARKVAESDCTLILADDTLPLAEHAAEMGWIDPAALPAIREEKLADEAPPSPVEKLLGQDEAAEAPAPTVEVSPDAPAAAVEAALDETPTPGDQPPTVIVDGDSERQPPTPAA
jgi:phosphatidate phosphatase APP1